MLHKTKNGKFFYHVPKTGGRNFIHFNIKKWKQTHHFIPTQQQLKNKKIIVIIRDPVDRFLSAYYHTQQCSIAGTHVGKQWVKKIQKWGGWKNSPLEMIKEIYKEIKDIDILNFFHFNTQFYWHQNFDPSQVTYIDFKKLNKGHFKTPSTRKDINEEENIEDIIKIIKILYAKDYKYFNNIPHAKSISEEWL